MPLCDIIATKEPEDVAKYLETFDRDSLLISLNETIYKDYIKKKKKTDKAHVKRFHIGYTILHYAIDVVEDRNASIIDLLLQHNIGLLTQNIDGKNISRGHFDPYTLTIVQEDKNRLAITKILLKHEERMLLLIYRFTEKHFKAKKLHKIRRFFGNSTLVASRNREFENYTPLQIAVMMTNSRCCNEDIIQVSALLLPYDWAQYIHQALNIYDHYFYNGYECIHIAVWNGGHFEVIKALISKDKKLLEKRIDNPKSSLHNFTPLHIAVYQNLIHIVTFFLACDDENKSLSKATINNQYAIKWNGYNAIQIAKKQGFKDIVGVLLDHNPSLKAFIDK